MSDLISRQAILDRTVNRNSIWNKITDSEGNNLEDILDSIPSIEKKGEWIPVSERVPVLRGKYKISDDVLITNGFEIDMGYLVERKGKIFWHYYGGDFEVGIKDEDNDATAWMPLPEPYKAERGEE